VSEENKAIVRRFYTEVANQGNLGLADELMAPDYAEHWSPASSGIAGFRQFAMGLAVAFPDLQVTVEDLIAEGNRVAARVTVRATHKGAFAGLAPTGRQVSFEGIDIFEIEGARIVGRWNLRNLLSLMEQLGA
jgi:steroid delta-isomerase-like uncharacterized protein